MTPEFTAELAKLAQVDVDVRESRTGKLKRALQSTAAIGAGAGLGYGAGRLLGKSLAPRMQTMSPGAQGWVKGLARGGLLAAGLGAGALMSRATDYVEGGKRGSRDPKKLRRR